MDFRYFDVQKWLSSAGISYTNSGRNVSSGWIGLKCPFCSDPSNHLGINLNTNLYSCFRCSAKGNAISLIAHYENCSYGKAYDVLEEFRYVEIPSSIPRVKPPARHFSCRLPAESTKSYTEIHFRYFQERSHDLHKISLRNDLYFTSDTGDYKWRVIAPVYENFELMTFQSVDVTGRAKIKYKNQPADEAIKQCKHCLYNIDTVKNTAIVVEGLFDAWRIGDGAVATFGIGFSKQQAYALSKIKNVFILYDADKDALRQANRLSKFLVGLCNHVEILQLEKDDPDKLSDEQVRQLRKEIFG